MKDINTLSLSTIVEKNKELLESSVDDETILLSMINSKYYGMDPVASRIWQLLEKPMPINDIINTLCKEYDVTTEKCRNDVIAFLENLIDEELINHT